MSFLLLPLLFFVISLIYSSAGFGGGSMYLAILSGAIFTLALPQGEIKTLALLCNAAVATYSSIQFIRKKFIDWKSNLLLLSLSVPFVLLATLIKLEEKVFLLFLSIGLLLSAFFMVMPLLIKINRSFPFNKKLLWPFSATIGFISGLTGIGGGVYLSPFLYFSKWGEERKIAATTSLFIAVNSWVALVPMLFQSNNLLLESSTYYLIIAVLAGALIGNLSALKFLPKNGIRLITIGILLYAGIRLLLRSL
jgi:uncharacterized membrane protein YfcA